MINGELIIDSFAGGGGTSTGIELATGYSPDIAINHDPEAIKMHKANHPRTRHYCESVWDVDPEKACGGRPVALAWFSPDCKHFSKAKGGKPKDKAIRGLAWVALRWAAKVRPRVIMLENVEEFKTWGPLNRRHRPIKAKQGETFRRFIRQLEALDYKVEYTTLIAADYGAPTVRKRFFLIARCDGKPIVFPPPTHGKADSEAVKAGLLKPYAGAYTKIDFSLPCPSIFDTSEEIKEKYGIRAVRPLAEKTMQRIARGLKKFILDNPEPFIVQCNHGGERRAQDIHMPMPTITAKHGYGIVEPRLVPCIMCNNENNTGASAEDPLPTVTTGNRNFVISPTLIQCKYDNAPGDIQKPIGTVTTVGSHLLVAPALIQYHSETSDGEVRGQGTDRPIMTVDGSNRYAPVSAFLHKYFGGGYTGAGDSPGNPLPTVTAQDHNSIVSANLIQLNNNSVGSDARGPLPTVTAGGGHFAEVRAFMVKYYGNAQGQDIRKPLDTVTPHDRFGLVTVHGTDYMIADIGLRMLEPKELYGCQGFPEDYIIDRDFEGKAYPRSEQVKRCGNAVPPPFAEALVRSNLPELCIGKRIPNMRIKDSGRQQEFLL